MAVADSIRRKARQLGIRAYRLRGHRAPGHRGYSYLAGFWAMWTAPGYPAGQYLGHCRSDTEAWEFLRDREQA
jgi:hypothetical protein